MMSTMEAEQCQLIREKKIIFHDICFNWKNIFQQIICPVEQGHVIKWMHCTNAENTPQTGAKLATVMWREMGWGVEQ